MSSNKPSEPSLLFLVNDPAFFLSHRSHIARAARERGFQVEVAAPPLDGAAEIAAQGFLFHPINLERWGHSPLRELKTIIGLIRLYRRVRPTLVHQVTIKPVLYGTLAARIAGVPAVVNAVSGRGYVFLSRGPLAKLRRKVIQFLYRLILRHPRQKIIFQNPDDQSYFISQGLIRPQDAVLIRGSGVDTQRFEPRPEPDSVPVVMFPSRLLWEKGIEEFVAAASQLKRNGLSARFVAAGAIVPGNPGSVSARQLEVWQRENHVEFWGECADMEQVMSRAHIICLPSYGEGLPKALLEAAACARPIVTTDVPGCREVVRNGYNGYLVPPRDGHALAAAISALVADKTLRQEMGRLGRRIIEEEGFTEQEVVRQTLNVYEDLCSNSLAELRN